MHGHRHRVEVSNSPSRWRLMIHEIEKWVHINIMLFNEAKSKALNLNWNNLRYKHRVYTGTALWRMMWGLGRQRPAREPKGCSPQGQWCPGLQRKRGGQ